MRVAAIGKFDALHLGHRALVAAAAGMGQAVTLRFSGMAEVLGWAERPSLIADVDRAQLLAAWLASDLVVPFTEVRHLDGEQFLAFLKQSGIGGLVVGEDFRFGHKRSASVMDIPALAQRHGLRYAIVSAVRDEGGIISSSRVREALARGEVASAASLLGRPYRLRGTVVRGDGRGSKIGIPTCNIGQQLNQAPGGGVYAGRLSLPGQLDLPAAINAGHVPTVGGDRPFVVEAHILDWQGDAYGAAVAVDFVARIRDEQKFAGLPELVVQIKRDIATVKQLLA